MNNFKSIGKDHHFMNYSVFLMNCMFLAYKQIVLTYEVITERKEDFRT